MLANVLQNRLAHFSIKNRFRKYWVTDVHTDNKITVNGINCIHFCSNDYLGMANDSRVKKAFAEGASRYGLGSGASAQVGGYRKPHQLLENQFAEFLNRDRAILFNSGYQANMGVITALIHRQDVIVADKQCHASLIDGMVLSQATYYRYRHHDVAEATRLLQQPAARCKYLISESVFSIDGSLSDLKKLATLSSAQQATLIIDDAHAIGWLGKSGGGGCEYYGLNQQDVPILITPLGKAFGSLGAMVSGNHLLIENVLQFSRNHRYTTALPPAICYATAKIIEWLKTENWRREKLNYLINFFIVEAKKRALPLFNEDATPIQAIAIKSEKKAMLLQENLLQAGYFVACIRPPTVTENSTCLRISLNCFHKENDIVYLLDCLASQCS